MPAPEASMAWGGALVWFGGIVVASFLVTWVVTDVLHVGRTWYVAVLAVMTAGLTVAYLGWSGTDAAGFLRTHWAWGLVGAVLSAGVTARGARRVRGAHAVTPLHGLARAGRVLWEDVVYGAAEGMLLSVLPVLTIWQASDRLGWTGRWWEKLASGAVAIVASAIVIGVHHLGYREFRGRQVVFPIAACLSFSLAFLLTGNPIAPTLGHTGLHGAFGATGVELPPYGEVASREEERRVDRRAA